MSDGNQRTIGVLLMAYGGPNTLDDIGPYLADIRHGRPTSQELLDEITDRYRQIGGSSPILALTNAQATAVEAALNDDEAAADGVHYKVYVGMRHWHPYIEDVVPVMLADGINQIIAIVMAPHFSRMSIGAYMGKVNKALVDRPDVQVAQVASWKDEPAFIAGVADRVREGLEQFAPDEREDVPLLFTAHSLPARILESGDPYVEELQTSVRLVVEQLQPKEWHWAFQSQGASAEVWLGPTVEDTLVQLQAAGKRNLLLIPIGFVCDHVEVLFDVDIEHRHQAQELGIRLERPRMLNDDPALVEAVTTAIRRTAAELSVAV